MAEQTIFQDREELERLAVQRRLLDPLERPLYRRLAGGRAGLRLLELGCSDGARMAERFSGLSISRAVGLEYCAGLATRAQETYGGGGWSFHPFDLDGADLLPRLKALMDREGIDSFDLIDASFVLSHLKRPEPLLRALREVLAPGGQLAVVEADDAGSSLSPDPDRLLEAFLTLLSQDPLAGDRGFIRRLPALLEGCGCREARPLRLAVTAAGEERERKADIFRVFFSYFPQDMALLSQEREGGAPAGGEAWAREHFAALRANLLSPESEIAMGVGVVTWGRA